MVERLYKAGVDHASVDPISGQYFRRSIRRLDHRPDCKKDHVFSLAHDFALSDRQSMQSFVHVNTQAVAARKPQRDRPVVVGHDGLDHVL